jgi:hypothetical protein
MSKLLRFIHKLALAELEKEVSSANNLSLFVDKLFDKLFCFNLAVRETKINYKHILLGLIRYSIPEAL